MTDLDYAAIAKEMAKKIHVAPVSLMCNLQQVSYTETCVVAIAAKSDYPYKSWKDVVMAGSIKGEACL